MSNKYTTYNSKYQVLQGGGNISTSKNAHNHLNIGVNSSPGVRITGTLEVNGVNIMDALSKIEQRLAMLRPNLHIESQFEELRKLGDQYRELEAELSEKCRIWNILSDQPDDAA
jgi:hypothetical protein